MHQIVRAGLVGIALGTLLSSSPILPSPTFAQTSSQPAQGQVQEFRDNRRLPEAGEVEGRAAAAVAELEALQSRLQKLTSNLETLRSQLSTAEIEQQRLRSESAEAQGLAQDGRKQAAELKLENQRLLDLIAKLKTSETDANKQQLAELAERVAEAQNETKRAEQRAEQAQRDLDASEAEIEKARRERETMSQHAAALEAEIDNRENKIANLTDLIAAHKSDEETLRKRLDIALAKLAETEQQRSSDVQQAESAAEEVASELAEARARQTAAEDALAEKEEALAASEKTLAASEKALAAKEEALAANEETLAANEEAAETRIAKLSSNLEAAQQARDEAKSAEAAASSAVAAARAEIADLNQKVAELEGRPDFRAELDEALKAADQAERRAATAEQKLAEIAAELDALRTSNNASAADIEAKLATSRQTISELENQLAASETARNSQKQLADERAREVEALSAELRSLKEVAADLTRRQQQSANAAGLTTSLQGLNIGQSQDGTSEVQAAALSSPTHAVGSDFRDCPQCPEMVVVPPGRFTIGSPNGERHRKRVEGPQTDVAIGQSFALARHEVTRGEWRAFVGATGYDISGCGFGPAGDWRNPGFEQDDDHPVVCVSYNDAQAYVKWLNESTGGGYRLPSEAEWEYAARAGAQTRFPHGDDLEYAEICDHANIAGTESSFAKRTSKCADDYVYTAPVFRAEPNAFGLRHMIGNALEWVEDCWVGSYADLPGDGSSRSAGGNCKKRVLRGAGWRHRSRDARVARRFNIWIGDRFNYIGFRVAKSLR